MKEGVQLRRRQDLPGEASLEAETAMLQADRESDIGKGTAVISHGWLAVRHPDPSERRASKL